ncbi:MAG: acetate--CoA ligase [Nitrospinae bacterium]|nr:acetate--CoA ligase [Nitrospinota bacterium]MBF0634448.1 acetate--CoA ligase [Nitrospinota bacterium]
MSTENRVFSPSPEFSGKAWVKNIDEYRAIYKKSIEDPEKFWSERADTLSWFKKWSKVREYDFINASIKWFDGGEINVSVNCLDRHLATNGDKTAILWEADNPTETRKLTYREVHREVCKFANVLKKHGVSKGDRVTIYMGMIPELAIAMLACARIGAIHSVVFGGFSAEALRDRIQDCGSNMIVTADGGYRAGKVIELKKAADIAASHCPTVKQMIVVRRTGHSVDWVKGRDIWWDDAMANASDVCEPAKNASEDPLFILYTSGSTGKPKGVLHTTAGYLLYVSETFKYIFDYHDEDVYWCTADCGWVTGHSYVVYGPMANAATTVMFEGVPTYPEPDRFWKVVEKHKVNIFYTAPTAIRAVAREGEKWPAGCDLSSLRLLGTVGEPINPEAWMWYHKNAGREKCPIVDTWWQTETGGILITPLPGAIATKPGSATLPFFGVEPEVIRQDGSKAAPNEGGYLVIKAAWPGIMRTVYGHHARFRETYFSQYPGKYFTGDGARVDNDGYYWLMGRVDDVINVAGHRIGTAEVESALVSHDLVAESAVVGYPHDIKGQGIYAFVTLNQGVDPSAPDLRKKLLDHVTREIGPIAKPDIIQFAPGLPKTRSGKIMRRILRKIAENDITNLGDTTTLADPAVVDNLVTNRPKT